MTAVRSAATAHVYDADDDAIPRGFRGVACIAVRTSFYCDPIQHESCADEAALRRARPGGIGLAGLRTGAGTLAADCDDDAQEGPDAGQRALRRIR